MNINDEYFARIIYQKGAIEKLSGLLEKENCYKKVFFIASKTPYQKFGALVVNQFNLAGREFVFELIDDNACLSQAIEASQKVQKSDFVVCLGGGTVADFAKVVAREIGANLISIPTSVSNSAHFSKQSYLNQASVIKTINCPWAYKIIVDEDFIKGARKENVDSGIEYILSFWELVFNYEIQNLLFFQKNDASFLKILLAKLNDLYIQKQEIDPLYLMDIMIDLGYFLKDVNPSYMTAFSLALLLKNSNSIKGASFGKLCLLSSQMLQASYEKYLSYKKLDINNFIDFGALSIALNNLNINPEMVSFSAIKNLRTNRQLFLKLNAVRHQVLGHIEKTKEKLCLTAGTKTKTFYDFKKCLSAFSVLPYVYDCLDLTNVLFSSGLIVC